MKILDISETKHFRKRNASTSIPADLFCIRRMSTRKQRRITKEFFRFLIIKVTLDKQRRSSKCVKSSTTTLIVFRLKGL